FSFSAYLNGLVEKRGLSIRSVAKSAGVSFSHLSRILRDPSTPTPKIRFLDALPPVLNVPFSTFLFYAGQFLPEAGPRSGENCKRPKLTPKHLLSYLETISREDIMLFLNSAASEDKLRNFLHLDGKFLKTLSPEAELTFADAIINHINSVLSAKKFDSLTTMDILVYFSELVEHDLDEILFMFDLIPSKFYSHDHSPNFATKLDRLSEWLDYVVCSLNGKQGSVSDSTNAATETSPAALWVLYFDKEKERDYWKTRENTSADAEYLPYDLKIASMGETAQISITLPAGIALSLLPELAAMIRRVADAYSAR
ncbi:MAG: helix-turn-helix domain-containing protein, partial [Desulfofundulus sp.]